MSSISILSTTGTPISLKVCTSFFDKLMGLMFQKELPLYSGVIFRYKNHSIVNTSIHMLFMHFPITVIWCDKNNIVVDKTIAKPWHLAYAPAIPANTVIEIHAQYIDEFQIGDKINFDDEK